MTMIKSLIFFAIILVLGVAFAWLADRPGEMLITWQGQQIELSIMTAVSILLAIIVAVMFTWWVIRLVLNSPAIMSKFLKTRRKDRGYLALSQGLIAAGSGDVALAKKLTKQSKSLLSNSNEPLIKLLDVQTAMIEGRHDDVRKTLQDMSEQPETATLGLRGLYLEAKRLGAEEAARQYAIKAADNAPHLEWAGNAAVEYSCKDGEWDDAIRRLEKQRTAGVITPDIAKRKKAVLLTGRAMSRTDGELSQIVSDATNALNLAPDLVPAALVAAKACFRQSQLRKGSRILEKIWKSEPHAQIAETYLSARIGDTAADRLKRAKKLESLKANNVESLFIVAKAALDAHNFDLAREKIEAAARIEPRESMYLLLADIEEADTGDQGRVRYWLAQALRADKDPQWTSDGYVSDEWAAISPVTGKLDTFEWKVPVTALQGPVVEGEARENSFEEAMSHLPAIALQPATQGTLQEEAPAGSPTNDGDTTSAEESSDDTSTVTEKPETEPVEDSSDKIIELEAIDERKGDGQLEPTIATDAIDDNPDSTQTQDEEVEATNAETNKQNEGDIVQRLGGPVDDPGIDESQKEDEKDGRFRLF